MTPASPGCTSCPRRTDGVGAFAQDHFLNRVSSAFAVILGIPLGAVLKAMGHLDKARRERTVLGVTLELTTCRHRREGGAVVVAGAVEDFVLLAAEALVGNLANHFKGLLVGLRS